MLTEVEILKTNSFKEQENMSSFQTERLRLMGQVSELGKKKEFLEEQLAQFKR